MYMNYFALPDLYTRKPPKVVSPEHILRVTANYFNMTVEKMVSKVRCHDPVLARGICFLLIKQRTNIPLTTMGLLVGGRHYSTVIYAIEETKNRVELNDNIRRIVAEIETLL